ncbi:beta-lactamase domain-containing protein [Ditylenchus destructor]|uniref:Beta-lactamase domain-containing protein n=1 Tax=Ditylenchus destructor TaxID=166010 RepID=A0AAD4RCI1_9BILA|nr:beta-lactamase domain-containing protein [Ditylenchus destructor]
MPRLYGKPDTVIHGFVDPRFEALKQTFRDNFADSFERDGAHLSVYYRGNLVVDLWGGMADSAKGKAWNRNTKNVLFSLTKPLSALCIAKLVDDGLIKWDDEVSKFWREYAQNGKKHTTIDHVLAHQSGLPYIDDPISLNDVINRTSLLNKLAAAKPVWKPGTATGYHTITQGMLIDGIIQNADPKHRTLEIFFDEEIAHGVDISIGAKADTSQISFLTLPDSFEIIRDIIIDPRMLIMYLMFSLQPSHWPMNRMMNNPNWIRIDDEVNSFNDPFIQRLPMGSLMGISNARELAKLFSSVLDGKFFHQNSTLEALFRPIVNDWHLEQTVLYPLIKGRGFIFDPHPREPGKYVFGHPGYGCQTLHLDPINSLSVVYLSNGLKSSTSTLCMPWQKLLTKLYDIIYE